MAYSLAKESRKSAGTRPREEQTAPAVWDHSMGGQELREQSAIHQFRQGPRDDVSSWTVSDDTLCLSKLQQSEPSIFTTISRLLVATKRSGAVPCRFVEPNRSCTQPLGNSARLRRIPLDI